MDPRRLSVSPSAHGCINYKKPDHNTSTFKTTIIATASTRTGLWDRSYLHSFLGHGALSATVYSNLSDWEAPVNADVVAKQLKQAHGLCTDADDEVVPLFLFVNDDPWLIWHNTEPEDPSRSRWRYLVVDGVGEDKKEGEWVDQRMSGVGVVLCAKICGALTSMGYGVDDVKNVGKLVERNLVTANAVISEEHGAEIKEYGTLSCETLHTTVSEVLAKMFGSGSDQCNFRVNSNEAVLLVNNLGGYSATDLRTITHYAVEEIQHNWGILPVRVYAGTFMKTQVELGFSLTVLNVVNTDIGGPSMIQLLDRDCDAPGWNSFIRKEIRHGWNLLSREDREDAVESTLATDKDMVPEEMVDDGLKAKEENSAPNTPVKVIEDQERSAAPVFETTTLEGHESIEAPVTGMKASESVPEVIDSPVTTQEQAVSEAQTGILASLSKALGYSRASGQGSQKSSATGSEMAGAAREYETEDDEVSENEHAESSSHQQQNTANITHPTFDHGTASGSLIDMISKQSQKLGISDPDEIKAGNEYATSASKSAAETAELSGEDDYEIV